METIAIYIGYFIIYLIEVFCVLVGVFYIYKFLDFLFGRFTKLGGLILMYSKMDLKDRKKMEELFKRYTN